eukprot:SAG31_NODE_12921_length_906_cov_1.480793_1_plen_49_part_00
MKMTPIVGLAAHYGALEALLADADANAMADAMTDAMANTMARMVVIFL